MAKEIKYEIPDVAVFSKCRKCGALITFIKMESGKYMPVDEDGTAHWITCPYADSFRKGRH